MVKDTKYIVHKGYSIIKSTLYLVLGLYISISDMIYYACVNSMLPHNTPIVVYITKKC